MKNEKLIVKKYFNKKIDLYFMIANRLSEALKFCFFLEKVCTFPKISYLIQHI